MFVHAVIDWARWVGVWPLYFGFLALFFGVMAGSLYRTSETGRRARYAAASRNPVFCRDCRWAVPDTKYGDPKDDLTWSIARCMHVSARDNPANFLVIGHDRPQDMAYCTQARSDRPGRCGPRGRYWEKGQQLIAPAPPAPLEAPK